MMNKRERKKAATLIAAVLLYQSPPDVDDDLSNEFDQLAVELARRYDVNVWELPFVTNQIVDFVMKGSGQS